MNRSKSDCRDNKKLYKDFLDLQIVILQINQNKKKELNSKLEVPDSSIQMILPSYFHENRPIAKYKKAADTINMMKNSNLLDNPIDFLNPGKLNDIHYAWESQLNHNPITHPLLDINYNKYLTKSLTKNKIKEDSSLLQNVANSILN